MPTFKPKKPCNFNGCPKLVESGTRYCEEHTKKQEREYDKNRGTAHQRGYDVVWARFRLKYLGEHPLCVVCEEKGIIKPSFIPHHIIPLNEGGEKYDEDNLKAVCMGCHQAIHKSDRWKKK